MEDNSKFWTEIKTLVMFLASGAFVTVHKEFMEPSREIFPLDHWTTQFHHWFHFGIGAVLQVLFFLWLLRIVWNVLKWDRSNNRHIIFLSMLTISFIVVLFIKAGVIKADVIKNIVEISRSWL